MFNGDSLRVLREKQGMTRLDMARRSGIAISTICRLEQGVSVPSIEMLVRLANTFKLPLRRLLQRIGILTQLSMIVPFFL